MSSKLITTKCKIRAISKNAFSIAGGAEVLGEGVVVVMPALSIAIRLFITKMNRKNGIVERIENGRRYLAPREHRHKEVVTR